MPFGPKGQERLARARVAVVGLGGLGSHVAAHLARAGVGELVMIDRDVVEESNLPRQALYTLDDARAGAPKAEAAAAHLAEIGGPTRLQPRVKDLSRRTIDGLLEGAEIVLDGLDNFGGRFLLNDWCHRARVPWVYAGAVGGSGNVLLIGPEGAPCLRCLFPAAEDVAGGDTCDTVGVLTPLPALVASLEVAETFRWFAGGPRETRLYHVDAWDGRVVVARPRGAADDCPCCARGEFPALAGEDQESVRLCGRDTVQIVPPRERACDLDEYARRWQGLGGVQTSRYLARLRLEGAVVTLFRDGRALVQGTSSRERARALYDRYVGS